MTGIVWTELIPTAITTGVLGIVWFDVRRFKSDIKKQLYHEDGMTKFIPRGECAERENSYHSSVCRKIDEIKNIQEKSEQKRDSARSASDSRLRAIEHSLIQLSTIQKIVLGKQGLLSGKDFENITILGSDKDKKEGGI